MRRSAAIRAVAPVTTPNGNRNARQLTRRVEKLPDQQVRELVEAYRAGDSTYVLARRFGMHRQTVTRHLRRAGVVRRQGATAER